MGILDDKIVTLSRPYDCRKCEWHECTYTTTCASSYQCNLMPESEKQVYEFDVFDDVHIPGCPIIWLQKHDKEIRDRAIDEFAEDLKKVVYESCMRGTIAIGLLIDEEVRKWKEERDGENSK